MAGAHFDSWIAGDGAADNGAGSVIVMEAARILRQLGVRPEAHHPFRPVGRARSRACSAPRNYVEQHLRQPPGRPPGLDGLDCLLSSWSDAYPDHASSPGYGALKAYFNIDNGSGKLRGIYAEGNAGAVPLLQANGCSRSTRMGASTGRRRHDRRHRPRVHQAVGLQGFQFIQDPLDYESRVHHSSIDTLDHMEADDLRQAAVVLAGVLLAAANSDKELPRPPLPTPAGADRSVQVRLSGSEVER